ncbi:metallophosphoesterase family protein [Carnobacterium sp.]|uniref:metallophosphoesterase family protein n=1 Tax=Carnobacterium sp. TaxID=48221 RepID=UPI003C73C48E
MKTELFAIGDVHGQITLLKEMLTHWDESKQQLLFIGDLGDRGENPKACFILANELVKEKEAIWIKGNHEEMLLNFLENPEENYDVYKMNGGMKTLETFLHSGLADEYSPTEIAMLMTSHYPTLKESLKELPLYYEWGDYVFVHAGVDLSKKDWRKTAPKDFVWIREPFHSMKNNTGKKIVFGHTITPSLYGDNKTSNLWLKDNKIGIDGGAVYGGSLLGVVFSKTKMLQHYKLINNGYVWNGKS